MVTQYRFVAPAIFGLWRDRRGDAVQDALEAGQAYRKPGRSGSQSIRPIILHEWTIIEERGGEQNTRP